MKKLISDADIYVGDAFEILLEIMNDPIQNPIELEKHIIKFMPLMHVGIDGNTYILIYI